MKTKQQSQRRSKRQLTSKVSGHNIKVNQFSSFTVCYCLILSLFITITVLSASIASAPSSSAAEQATSANASVTVSSVCTMTGTVITPHTATVMNGSYTENIGKTTLNSLCNDANGYSIYAVGFGNDTVGNTVLHSNSIGSTYDIPTGTSGSGSEWSMKVSSVAGTYAPSIDNNFDSYHTIPNRYTRVAYLGTSTSATTSSSVETTYATRISADQPAGTYEGKVKYILVHPSGDTPEELPSMQNVASWKETLIENEEITVQDSRDGQTYTVAKLCVAKSGNNCTDWQIWMTQNLNFAPDPTKTYTHADTDLGYTTSDPTATWQPLAETMTDPAIITNFASGNPESVTGWTNDFNLPHYAEGKVVNTNNEVIVYNGTKYEGMTACVNAGHTASQCQHYQVGNYYNWPASIASNNASGISAQYTVAPDSVCPAGWRLPKGLTGSTGNVTQSEFNALLSANGVANGTDLNGGTNVGYVTDGFNKIRNSPLYFTESGIITHTIFYYFTVDGRYLSSSVLDYHNSYYMIYSSIRLVPAASDSRGVGISLRCVAR